LPHGRPGQATWSGTTDNPEILRVDSYVDLELAAPWWLPGQSHAVELEPGQRITMLETLPGGR
jgi:hypothetical protein